MADDILVGRILGPHGLAGEVKLKSFTHDPAAIASYGPLHARNQKGGPKGEVGLRLTITRAKPAKDHLIVRFAEIADRTAAEAVKGLDLHIARDQLPPAAAGEFYLTDLAGLDVRDGEGRSIGRVHAVADFGGGPILVITQTDGSEMMLPFADDFVREVNLASGFIAVDVPGEIEARGDDDWSGT